MNKQEIFDKVWDYFVTKGNNPGMDGLGCVYYGDGGAARCAVGCLLPDDVAKEMPSGLSVVGIVRAANPANLNTHLGNVFVTESVYGLAKRACEALFGSDALSKHDSAVRFFTRLQDAHDAAANCDSFREAVRDNLLSFAGQYELKVPAEAAA